MDIVTHAMMGTIAASPFLQSHPEAAAAFMFGSVAPDLDAFSRVFGRRAFLGFHQTWSHAFPVIAGIGLVAWGLREGFAIYAPWAPLAFALGMAFHSILDWTNTYGITLLAPFSRRRFCREWVFFIDSVVIASCFAVFALLGARLSAGEPLGHDVQLAWAVALLVYWLIKVGLRARGLRFSPEGTLSLLPSALVPWTYLGCARQAEDVVLFEVNTLTGAVSGEERVPILDGEYGELLAAREEWRVMQTLTPAYHLVAQEPQQDGLKLVCRDLRTRNFKTRFGQLDLLVDGAGQITESTFHV